MSKTYPVAILKYRKWIINNNFLIVKPVEMKLLIMNRSHNVHANETHTFL